MYVNNSSAFNTSIYMLITPMHSLQVYICYSSNAFNASIYKCMLITPVHSIQVFICYSSNAINISIYVIVPMHSILVYINVC